MSKAKQRRHRQQQAEPRLQQFEEDGPAFLTLAFLVKPYRGQRVSCLHCLTGMDATFLCEHYVDADALDTKMHERIWAAYVEAQKRHHLPLLKATLHCETCMFATILKFAGEASTGEVVREFQSHTAGSIALGSREIAGTYGCPFVTYVGSEDKDEVIAQMNGGPLTYVDPN